MNTEPVVVLITVPSADVGRQIARALVDERLAACVNLLPPMTSIYRWQGAVEEESEQLLICKTRRALAPALIEAVKSRHPYEVPEIIALPLVAGFQPYLDWIAAETRPA